MTVELNTLAPKKWSGNYGGNRPTLDSSNGVSNGDYAIDTSTSPQKIWKCTSATFGSPIWVRDVQVDVITISTTPYTLSAINYLVLANTTSTNITVNLPAASTMTGKVYHIKKIDSSANYITVDANGGEFIDGALTVIVSGQYDNLQIICDGTNWNIV